MSNVPKSKRKETNFITETNFKSLSKEIADLILNDFGYRGNKTQYKIDRYYNKHITDPNVNEICDVLNKKKESFETWFIDEEARRILDILRDIQKEFSLGNSIYVSENPSKLFDFIARRYHITKAIGLCYDLKQEINFVIEILPVDKNRFVNFNKKINYQIALYKGVRQASNKFLKHKEENKTKILLEDEITKLFESIINIIRKLLSIEETPKVDEQECSE